MKTYAIFVAYGPILILIGVVFLLALVSLYPTPADASIMSSSEADLARDYAAQPEGLDVRPWWMPKSGGIVDLFWWIRKTIYVPLLTL